MKKPNLKKLKVNEKETRRVRASIAAQKSIKITINIDAATLKRLKSSARKTGVPYQRLLNKTLQAGLREKDTETSRLDKIEAELESIKRKLAA